MRQPKFRGFCLETKEWHYGHGWFKSDYTEEYKQQKGIEDTAILHTDGSPVECELRSMGQYTGLQDSKGKDIYGGDILQDFQGNGEVQWFQEHCGFKVYSNQPKPAVYNLEADHRLKDSEIVGNIYTNPELLEVRE